MASSAPVSAWTFEDDEWLKNAFEGGTSFESLNEGAVHFSPRFSFQEPRDPWDSLTYSANASLEPSPMECVDSSASTLQPKLHLLEYEGGKSGHKRKVKDDEPDSYNPVLKRVGSSVVENIDSAQSTDYVYGQEKQNHVASPVSNCESRQHFLYFKTDSDAAAFATLTESWEFEEAGPFGFEGETGVEFDETSLTCADIDVGDSFTLCQIPTQNTNKSISELTYPERQVDEKESAANSSDLLSAGDANESEFLGFDVHSDAMDQIPCHNMEHFVPSTDGNSAAGSSTSIMDLSELDEFLFTDIDGNDTANIPNLDSFFLDFAWEENITNVECSSIPGGGACSRDDVNYGQFMNCSSESAISRSTAAANPELPSAPAADDPELHIAFPPEAQILPSKPNADPELCNGVICCVLNTEETEIPCNDDADFTLSSRSHRPVSSRNNYHFGGIKAYYPVSSRNDYQLRGIKAYYLHNQIFQEKHDSSKTIQSKKAVYKAENIKETPDSSGTIQSNILSDLGINLPFIKRGD